MLLYEHDRGMTQPTKWHRDLCENEPLQWLLMGSVPSLTSLYEFRDRLSRFLPQWNSTVIGQAIAEGHTEAEVASLDGSTVAANASRHHLLNLETLDRRIEQLEQADSPVAASPEPAAGEAPSSQRRPNFKVIPPLFLSFVHRLPKRYRQPWTKPLRMLNPVGWPPRHADAPSNVSATARHANACASSMKRISGGARQAQGRQPNPDQSHRHRGLPGKG